MSRVLSGMRPTGPLHIGHLEGVLTNWAALQEKHECFYFVADWHVLTTDYERTHDLQETIRENVACWIACGLDPERSTLFIQSEVKEHAELFLLLSMLVPIPWLEQNPTYREQIQELRRIRVSPPLVEKIDKALRKQGDAGGALFHQLQDGLNDPNPSKAMERMHGLLPSLKRLLPKELCERLEEALTARDLSTLGFLAYPVLQTADIAMYKGNLVPVGEDQMPHVELSREIVRRFNALYGEVFPEPQGLLTPTPRLLGTDERKMSKSYGNAVFLGDTAEETEAKIKTMQTDPARVRRTDPGNPEICNVFSWHRLYSSEAEQEGCAEKCRQAAFGCIDCKLILVQNLNARLEPVRARRAELLQAPERIDEILSEGSGRARRIAAQTLGEVRHAMKIGR